jgi:peptidoglycan/xylan/chitin deacetylase (PgdA/CDA1 family)
MQVAITIDVEHDCPPYLTSYDGVERGLPRALELLDDEAVTATFFTTGDVARRYPELVADIVARGHELGSHGNTHRRFATLLPVEARAEIEDAATTLRAFGPVTSFRAPNLDFPDSYVPFLRDSGFTADSSRGRHKPGSFFTTPTVVDSVTRVPASTAPSVIRLPRAIREPILSRFRSPAVFFFHPWEFIDVTRAPIPRDCRYRTGQPALDTLRATITFFRRRGATFATIRDLAATVPVA